MARIGGDGVGVACVVHTAIVIVPSEVALMTIGPASATTTTAVATLGATPLQGTVDVGERLRFRLEANGSRFQCTVTRRATNETGTVMATTGGFPRGDVGLHTRSVAIAAHWFSATAL
jgi:hypothetical protein